VSFRLRLLVTSMTALAAGLGALVLAGNLVLRARIRAETSSTLRSRAQTQIAALSVAGRRVQVRSIPNDAVLDRQSWVFHGTHVIERPADASPALDRAATRLSRSLHPAERDGPADTRLRAQPVRATGGDGHLAAVVVVGTSLEASELLQRQILLGSLVVAALVLAAGGLAIRSAVDRALVPVARMSASAENWGAHDLDRRFGLGPPRDELTGLAATLDHLLARIAASRRHEQRLASEVAHELRTPIAGLRGRAELALNARGPGADAEREAALLAVVSHADRLEATIGTLLALARRELDPATTEVDVCGIAREVEGVELRMPSSLPPAEGDPDIVRRALSPLIENAKRHARSRVALELSVADGHVRIAVRDDGAGLDPELRERAFEPGVRGVGSAGAGAGLGLALARRLARSCGGDVVAGEGPGGCFVLELPVVGSVR
jgi:signal transduction histidine kinase